MIEICSYILLFFLYSFLGWCLEVLCKLISDHKFINRGFLIGPYCPIYGTGAIIMTFLLKKYLDDPITLWIMIILCCSILEYFVSFILEKIFHARWWDYSTNKFNINGRICLETMIPFSIFGLFILYKCNPFFLNLINAIPHIILYLLTIILLISFIVDLILSTKIIYNIQNITTNVTKKMIFKKDDTERITKLVREKIEKSKSLLNRRIIHAFPHLTLLQRTRNKNKKRH